MNEIVLLGAGGLAREIDSWNNGRQHPLNIVGCLDDNAEALAAYQSDLSVIGRIVDWREYDRFIMAIMDCNYKERMCDEIMTQATKRFVNFIHSDALLGDRTTLSEGLVLMPNALISCDVSLGRLILINTGTQIGHDVTIGDYTSIMANVDIGGGATIGKKVFIGSGATILPNVKIPDNTRIGAGSVIIKDIKEPGTYFGNPAKRIF